MQRSLFIPKTVLGTEDCLYLNIYVPKVKNNSEKLDVVVHIHGGGFSTGSGSGAINAKYVMDSNVIFVTINYRLGVFGKLFILSFFNYETMKLPPVLRVA